MNIKLLPPDPSYAELYHSWRNEDSALKYNPLGKRSVDEISTELEKMPKELTESYYGTLRWFIQADEEIVGSLSLSKVNHMMSTASIGYHLGEKYFRKGIGTKALGLWVDKIFTETNIRKLNATVSKENIGSHKVILRSGFNLEGTLVEEWMLNNKTVDVMIYGMLKSDRL